jgi:hypothetical protein
LTNQGYESGEDGGQKLQERRDDYHKNQPADEAGLRFIENERVAEVLEVSGRVKQHWRGTSPYDECLKEGKKGSQLRPFYSSSFLREARPD